MVMTEQRSYAEIWVVAGILLAVVLIARLPHRTDGAAAADSNARVMAVLGQSRRTVVESDFRGADVTAVIGECRLDLRQVVLQPGEEVVVDVLAVMGGVTIRVPDGWVVDTQAVPILGGLKDQRIPPAWSAEETRAAVGPAPRLVLHGAVLMGGIRITS